MRKLVLISLIISMALFAGCNNNDAEIITTEFENNQVVCIMCENQSGSGVLYDSADEQVIIVTAAHVVEGAESAEIVWIKSEAAEKTADIMPAETLEVSSVKAAEIIKIEGLDLAYLRIEDAEADWTVVQNGVETEENDSTELILQGYDFTGELIETTGTISETWIYAEDFQNHMMIGKAEAVPGMSGGGAFNQNGEFLGIVCGIDADNHVAILPAAVIASEYDVIVWE